MDETLLARCVAFRNVKLPFGCVFKSLAVFDCSHCSKIALRCTAIRLACIIAIGDFLYNVC